MDVRVSALGSPKTSPAFLAPDASRRIGLIVLETDLTMERDFARLAYGSGVAVFANRVAFGNPFTREILAAVERSLTGAAAALIPDAPFDVVHFGCTAASAVIGDAGVEAAVRAAKPGAQVTNPIISADTALRALDARRLSILTPYTLELSHPVADRFAALGFDIQSLTCLNIADDRDMGRLRHDVLVKEAVAAMAPNADALFISCTAVPSAEAVAAIEAEIGRPVVTSNQSAVWMALRLCGVETDVPGGGRLFACQLPLSDARGAA